MLRRAEAVGRLTTVILVGIVGLALGGCGSAGSSADASAEPSAAASPTAAASASAETSPSAAPPREGAFTWPDGDEPVVTRAMTGIDESFINPGAVIDHEGQLHMFANVFTAWPGTVEIAHLVSSDGVAWELAQDGPVMTSHDVPYTPAGHDVSTGFVTDDGTWVLVFTTVTGAEPWVIGIATAPSADGPWTVAPEPVLESGGLEAGEEGGLAWPSVVATDDGWAMYFTVAERPPHGGVIGMATSTDGLTWERQPDPVLEPDVATWELTSLDRPRVARTDDGRYVMVYAGRTLTDRGIAVSDDGVSWTRVGDGPAIIKSDLPVLGSDAWDAALIVRDGMLVYYLEVGFVGATGTQIHRAVTPVP